MLNLVLQIIKWKTAEINLVFSLDNEILLDLFCTSYINTILSRSVWHIYLYSIYSYATPLNSAVTHKSLSICIIYRWLNSKINLLSSIEGNIFIRYSRSLLLWEPINFKWSRWHRGGIQNRIIVGPIKW